MIDFLRTYLPWLLSCITLYVTWIAGDKHKYTWMIAFASQGIWFAWDIIDHAYGLLPLTIGLSLLYVRNHYMWNGKWQRMMSYLNGMIVSLQDSIKSIMSTRN